MTRIGVLRHVPHEGLGLWESVLTAHSVEYTYYDLDAAPDVPASADDCDAVIILGGPMSANDEKKYSWVIPELEFLRPLINDDYPLLGVCLGSQMIARAAGAAVTRNPQKEIGWGPVTVTGAAVSDPVFRTFPQNATLFHWHGETWSLPAGADLLLASPVCPHQAFRLHSRVYGLQCHVEVTPEMINDWCDKNAAELAVTPEAMSPAEMRAATPRFMPEMQRLADVIILRFLDLIG